MSEDVDNHPDRIEIRLEDLEPEPPLEVVLDDEPRVEKGGVVSGLQAESTPTAPPVVERPVLARRVLFCPPLVFAVLGAIAGVAAWAVVEPFASHARSGPDRLPTLVAGAALFFAVAGAVVGMFLGGGEWAAVGAGRKAVHGAVAGLWAGLVGGAIGGAVGQGVYGWLVRGYEMPVLALVLLRATGWSMVGTWLGLGLGLGERAAAKVRNGLIGGSVGGLVGGAAFQAVSLGGWSGPASRLAGLVLVSSAIGACLGLVETVAKGAWLEVLSGPLRGKQFPVYPEGTLIGTGARCQAVIPKDPLVSEAHAAIARQSGSFVLTDTGSQVGTIVNGRRVRRAVLAEGDVVQVGSTLLQFHQRPRQSGG